jgi:hypothetical protein
MVGRAFGGRSYSGNHGSTTNPDPDIDTAKDVGTNSAPDLDTAKNIGTVPGAGVGAREDGTYLAIGEIGFRHG